MTDDTEPVTSPNDESGTRWACIRTRFADSETATQVAAAVGPDNTADMETEVHGTTVRTEIARETTGGLQATVDDYVVNLQVAAQLSTQDGESSTTQQDK